MTRNTTATAILLAASLALAHSAFAQDSGHDNDEKHDHAGHEDHADNGRSDASVDAKEGRTIRAAVNGMVCDFCAQSLIKVLSRDRNVEEVGVSLEDKVVTIVLRKGGSLTDEEVEKAVINAGYNLASIERS